MLECWLESEKGKESAFIYPTKKKAQKVVTTKETVEKVQICIFVNFKDSQIK